jgi:hypothetical protein
MMTASFYCFYYYVGMLAGQAGPGTKIVSRANKDNAQSFKVPAQREKERNVIAAVTSFFLWPTSLKMFEHDNDNSACRP